MNPFKPIRDMRWMALAFLVLVFSGCAGTEDESSPASSGNPEADRRAEQRMGNTKDKAKAERTLYERLGGEAGIRAIVDDVTERAANDPRVNFSRANVQGTFFGGSPKAWDPSPANVARFKDHMVQFISLAAGGPTKYTGRDIGPVHKGMRITNNEFDAFVGDLKATMDRLNIAAREQRDLLAIVETTRKQIVEKP